MSTDTLEKTENLEHHQLICVQAGSNANKFYEITLMPDGDTVSVKYGRVGSTSTSITYSGGERKVQQLLRSKGRKGYRPAQTIGNMSHNVTNNTSLAISEKFLNPDNNTAVAKLIQHFVSINRHNIQNASGGTITVNDEGMASTPLGVITRSAIIEAKEMLGTNKPFTDDDSANYLSLVPQKISRVSDFTSKINDADFKQQQYDLLRSLETSVTMYESSINNQTKGVETNPFRYKLYNAPKNKAEEITKLYQESRLQYHLSYKWTVNNVFLVEDSKEHNKTFSKYQADAKGFTRICFHGTRPENLLSICATGIASPKSLASNGVNAAYTGSMFGNLARTGNNGVYVAPTKYDGNMKETRYPKGVGAATKSANYCTSSGWMGAARDQKKAYLFLTEVVTGKEARTTSGDSTRTIRERFETGDYDSIFVRGDHVMGAKNDEMVVPDDRIKILAVIELNT